MVGFFLQLNSHRLDLFGRLCFSSFKQYCMMITNTEHLSHYQLLSSASAETNSNTFFK